MIPLITMHVPMSPTPIPPYLLSFFPFALNGQLYPLCVVSPSLSHIPICPSPLIFPISLYLSLYPKIHHLLASSSIVNPLEFSATETLESGFFAVATVGEHKNSQ